MKTDTVNIDDLELDPDNARQHDEANLAAIQRSLARFGPGRSIVVDKNNRIRAGNGTIEAARAAGLKKVVVVEPGPEALVAVRRPEWDEQEAGGYSVADNRIAELARWDVASLEALIDGVGDIPLDDMGFTGAQFDELIGGFDVSGAPMPDLDPSEPDQVQMTFIFTSEQAATVAEALENAGGRIDSKKKGDLLALVCEGYLGR